MKFSSILAATALATLASAELVACRVNGIQVGVVDKDTGVCNIPIGASKPVDFSYKGATNYKVNAYYLSAEGNKYFNDIEKAGRTVAFPARLLSKDPINMFLVHLEQNNSNSTFALRKRFEAQFNKRDDGGIAALVALVKSTPGVAQTDLSIIANEPDPVPFIAGLSTNSAASASAASVASVECAASIASAASVSAASASSASSIASAVSAASIASAASVSSAIAAGSSTSTFTSTSRITKIVTITSCSDHVCVPTAVLATAGPTTVNVSGVVTSYTTWCPLNWDPITTTVTVTSCEQNKCEYSTTTCIIPVVTTIVTFCDQGFCTVVPVPTTAGATSSSVASVTAIASSINVNGVVVPITITPSPGAASSGGARSIAAGSVAAGSGAARSGAVGAGAAAASAGAAGSSGISSAPYKPGTNSVISAAKAGVLAKGSYLAALALPLAYLL